MGKFIDLTGKRFGRLIVIKRIGTKRGQAYWECLCDCGNYKNAVASDLKDGHTKSCGCLNKETQVSANTTHGMKKTRIYNTWVHMKGRCFNPSNKRYVYYGGRGITVCEKWLTFEGFYEDMKEGYSSKLTLDRINVNGNYEKSNCRWITVQEQQNNKRNNRIYVYNGTTDTLKRLCQLYDVGYGTVQYRLKKGLSIKDAIELPLQEGIKLKPIN
jgi:hypothetical protein